MQRLDVAMGMGGAISLVKFTFGTADLTAAATTQTISLQQNPIPGGPVTITPAANFIVPQGGAILGVKIHHTTAFTGSGLTALTVSVGSALSGAAFFASAFNIFQAVGDTVLQETSEFKTGQMSSVTPTVTFTSTGANLSVLTAGSVDIYLCLLNISTANVTTSQGVTNPALLPGASGAGTGV